MSEQQILAQLAYEISLAAEGMMEPYSPESVHRMYCDDIIEKIVKQAVRELNGGAEQ